MEEKLTSSILDNLNYQFMRRLKKEGFVTLKELFIARTKIGTNRSSKQQKFQLRGFYAANRKYYRNEIS